MEVFDLQIPDEELGYALARSYREELVVRSYEVEIHSELPTRRLASLRQTSVHLPHPTHIFLSTVELSANKLLAPVGQIETHCPHRVQASLLRKISGSTLCDSGF